MKKQEKVPADDRWEGKASVFSHLSRQERQVLILIAEGHTNREIAKALFLGEGTVRNYVSSIISKLGVDSRSEAAAYALKHNLREHILK
jgi:DNA-binding NarL/FixJ family response regulator